MLWENTLGLAAARRSATADGAAPRREYAAPRQLARYGERKKAREQRRRRACSAAAATREVQRARSAAATLGVKSGASDEDDGDVESIGGAVRRSAAYAYAMEARADRKSVV